jgi:hypothetical protein
MRTLLQGLLPDLLPGALEGAASFAVPEAHLQSEEHNTKGAVPGPAETQQKAIACG